MCQLNFTNENPESKGTQAKSDLIPSDLRIMRRGHQTLENGTEAWGQCLAFRLTLKQSLGGCTGGKETTAIKRQVCHLITQVAQLD